MLLILKKDEPIEDDSLTLFLKNSSLSIAKNVIESRSYLAKNVIESSTLLAKNVKEKLEHIHSNNENKMDFSSMTNRQSTAIDFIKTVLKTAEFALRNFQPDTMKNG